MHTEDSIDISIVIPVRNEEEYLPACLDAIFLQTTTASIEVIVVDNGSTDTSKRIALDRGVIVVDEPISGVGRARRAGTAEAKGTYILHIDADTQLPSEYVAQALERFARDSNLVCLGGEMHWYDASRIANGVRHILYRMIIPLVRVVSKGALGPIGNNMMFLRSVYQKCRGFDEMLKFGEDADLNRQLHVHGKVFFDFSLICYTSSRRFHLDRHFFVYCMNAFRICIGKKPLKNELPSA